MRASANELLEIVKTWENIGKNIENFLPFASRLRAISEENSALFSSLVVLDKTLVTREPQAISDLDLDSELDFYKNSSTPDPSDSEATKDLNRILFVFSCFRNS